MCSHCSGRGIAALTVSRSACAVARTSLILAVLVRNLSPWTNSSFLALSFYDLCPACAVGMYPSLPVETAKARPSELYKGAGQAPTGAPGPTPYPQQATGYPYGGYAQYPRPPPPSAPTPSVPAVPAGPGGGPPPPQWGSASGPGACKGGCVHASPVMLPAPALPSLSVLVAHMVLAHVLRMWRTVSS